jgi:soluble lytic murein transglycosylase-like protein
MKLWVPALILVCPAIAGDFTIFSSIGFLRDLPQPPAILMHPPDESVAVFAPQFPKDVRALIRAAAQKHGVPAEFVSSIVRAESNFNPDALSPKGAIGLMQLMPETAQQFGADPHIPEQNIDAGTRYLRGLMDKYRRYRNGLSRAIAAYNAGPGMVDRYRGTPPFRETRIYVARVLGFLKEFKSRRV